VRDHEQAAEFVLQGNQLIVRGEMTPDNEAGFSHELYKLLDSGAGRLELDLTGMHRISSAYVGATCLFLLVARRDGLMVTIRANGAVEKVLTTAGISDMANVTMDAKPGR
jgi:ABC-type transporter Mla MlaB component